MGDAANFDDEFDTFAGSPIRWQSNDGLMHAVEGCHVTRTCRTRLCWTKCGKHDVPAGKAWAGDDAVTCFGCNPDYEPSEVEQGLIPIPDGYAEQ